MDDVNKVTQTEPTVAVTLRWPESFWLAVTTEAKKRRMSLQDVGTVSVRDWLAALHPASVDQKTNPPEQSL